MSIKVNSYIVEGDDTESTSIIVSIDDEGDFLLEGGQLPSQFYIAPSLVNDVIEALRNFQE